MKIKYIHIKNFKSFGEQIIELENLVILLGQMPLENLILFQ